MAVRNDLVAMRELLGEPWSWCQDACWRDADGVDLVCEIGAVSCCLHGAGVIVTGADADAISSLTAILDEACGRSFVSWNDTPGRTHEEVLALLDGCIKDATPKQHYTHDGVPYFLHPRELELA